jgi:hypothetical protein
MGPASWPKKIKKERCSRVNFNLILNMSDINSNTLVKRSPIWKEKSKMFFSRILIYFSFILIPIWIQKTLQLSMGFQLIMMSLYVLFLVGQWFLLGKEVDHAFRIYFKVQSSVDRILYRLLLGMILLVLYFNFVSYFPYKWIYNTFWVTWVIMGLFYSWPTRGKIIQESVSTNLFEFRYLDSFEKTLFALTILFFISSFPRPSTLESFASLRLLFDPTEIVSDQLWRFLTVSYFPFKRYPDLMKLAISMHFYLVGGGTLLLTLYAIMRYFVSRRLSLLGTFLLVSTWSFPKILANAPGAAIQTTYFFTLGWTILWITKSSTYRTGLFLGLISYWGALLGWYYYLASILQMLLLFFLFWSTQGRWYRMKVARYASLGIILGLITFLANYTPDDHLGIWGAAVTDEFIQLFERKAFFSLSFAGVVIVPLLLWRSGDARIKSFQFDRMKFYQLASVITIMLLTGITLSDSVLRGFALLLPVILLSVIPLEFIFQSIAYLRSTRNMIYLIYILIAVLDSHLEGRIKILISLFE